MSNFDRLLEKSRALVPATVTFFWCLVTRNHDPEVEHDQYCEQLSAGKRLRESPSETKHLQVCASLFPLERLARI